MKLIINIKNCILNIMGNKKIAYFLLFFVLLTFISPSKSFADTQVTMSTPMNIFSPDSLFDWSLQNYNWQCVMRPPYDCSDALPVLQKLWLNTITYIVAPLTVIGILVISTMIIVGRNEDMLLNKLIIGFVVSLIFMAFSFSIIKFLYQVADMIQGFFLRTTPNGQCPPTCLSLTHIEYDKNILSQLPGLASNLNNLTPSIVQNVMTSFLIQGTFLIASLILLVRKIVLWLLLILSPLFPLTFVFPKSRSLIKGTIGMFMMWLLYAPILALLLNITYTILSRLTVSSSGLSPIDLLAQILFITLIINIDIMAPFFIFKQASLTSTAISDDIVFMRVLSGMEIITKSILNSLPKDENSKLSSQNHLNIRNSFFVTKKTPPIGKRDIVIPNTVNITQPDPIRNESDSGDENKNGEKNEEKGS